MSPLRRRCLRGHLIDIARSCPLQYRKAPKYWARYDEEGVGMMKVARFRERRHMYINGLSDLSLTLSYRIFLKLESDELPHIAST